MQAEQRQIITDTFEASNAGRIHFGQVIGQLVSAQVESYHVDYRAGLTHYYLPDGDSLALKFESAGGKVAASFDAEGVRAAIRGAQQGKVMYPEFKQLTKAAGCAGYTVWIAGRHVSYFGRKGETHVEHFPD